VYFWTPIKAAVTLSQERLRVRLDVPGTEITPKCHTVLSRRSYNMSVYGLLVTTRTSGAFTVIVVYNCCGTPLTTVFTECFAKVLYHPLYHQLAYFVFLDYCDISIRLI